MMWVYLAPFIGVSLAIAGLLFWVLGSDDRVRRAIRRIDAYHARRAARRRAP